MENFENIFNTICRICLSYGNSANMVSLTDNTKDDGLSSYGKAVLSFTNIYANMECLPDKMCAKCCSVLEQVIMFKRTCEKSSEKLTKFMHNLDSLDTQTPDFREKLCEYVLFMDSKDFQIELSNELSEISKESCSYINTEIEKTESFKTEDKYPSDTEIKKEDDFESNTEINKDLKESDEESDRWDLENDPMDEIQSNEIQEEANCSTGRPKRNAAKKKVFTHESETEEFNTDNNLANVHENDENSDSDESLDKEYNPGNNSETSDTSFDEDLQDDKRKMTKPNEKPTTFPCKICAKHLTKYAMKAHLLRHDDNNRHFICDQCGKNFFSPGELQNHIYAVHGSSPWICKKCGYKTSNKFSLKEHNRKHSGERPFKCDKCELTFSRIMTFKKHKKLHTEKTVQCPQCPKKFHTKTNLKSHFNSMHHRSFIYACIRCTVTYASDVSIRKHLVEVHGISKKYSENYKRIDLGTPPEVKEILGKK